MKALLKEMCPNCGGLISDERLVRRLPCDKCLPDDELSKLGVDRLEGLELMEIVEEYLRSSGRLKHYSDLVELEKKTKEFEDFFKLIIGNRPWSAQRTWAKRVFSGKSFTILAPTGVGKTVFGIVMALFLASREGGKSYIVVPTTLLVKQIKEKASKFAEKTGLNVKILAYLSGLNNKKRAELVEEITSGDYDILITTAQFLNRNFEMVKNTKFDFIFVDDVDAVLKSSRNVEYVLRLVGIPENAVSAALELVIVKRRISAYLRRGEEVPEELSRRYEELRQVLSSNAQGAKGVLVISTATGRPRGLRVKLFRELLGFEIGSRSEVLRNVIDAYEYVEEPNIPMRIAELVKTLGKGGLVFVPVSRGVEYAAKIVEELSARGIKAALVHAKEKRPIEEYIEGKLDVLVGVAVYYGVLVRGLDLPHIVKYAIFAGVPHFKFTAEVEELSPTRLIQIASNLRSLVDPQVQRRIDYLVSRLRRYFVDMDPAVMQRLIEAMREGRELSGSLAYIAGLVRQLQALLKDLMSREEVLEAISEKTLLTVREKDGRKYFVFPDAMTYIQASGRTSRLYAGGLTKGLSIVLVDDKEVFEDLVKQCRWYSDEIKWVSTSELDLSKLAEELAREREFVAKIIRGELRPEEVKDLVRTALIVVESPTKARTIASFFGKPSRRIIGGLTAYEVSSGNFVLTVIASKGHVVDLTVSDGFYGTIVSSENGATFVPVYSSIKRCLSCGEQFTEYPPEGRVCPKCGSARISDQIETVNVIRDLAREVDLVMLGTDPDTEGEKIAWDLYLLLAPFTRTIKRIEFHEVTRRAIQAALAKPRSIDERMVEAQMVRRIEDRWIGFVLSPKLWEKFGRRWLSAGRVQTPVLGWIIERFEEAKKSIRPVFRIRLEGGVTLVVDNISLDGKKPRDIKKELLEEGVKVEEVEVKEEEIAPPPPFSTDSLLREASARLGLGVPEIMRLAQDLFELGLITYHRTDSTRVSPAGIEVAKEYIRDKFGAEEFKPRTWGTGGAHECIRPTRPLDAEMLRDLVRQGVLTFARPLTARHIRLYDLIFRRFIASQMDKCVARKAVYRAVTRFFEKEYERYVGVVKQGFYRVYQPFAVLEPIESRVYKVESVEYRRIPTVPLYTQADIIEKMRKEGIGRPSTYAKIIKTLFERNYVVQTKRHKLLPTKLGMEVYKFLVEHYKSLISVERTRKVESMMDAVERGELSYLDALKSLYDEILKVAHNGAS